jgi:tetratricopeptide (TPR) repeat protein
LGAAYSQLGRYEDAIAQYKRSLAVDGRNLAIRFNLAMAYYKATLFAEAAAELDRFLMAAPQDLPQRLSAMIVIADCWIHRGDYKKVIELLSPLAQANPNERTVAYLLGSALISDGQVQRGQELIDRMFRAEDSAQAKLLIGSILLLADDAQAGIKELERAIQLDPKLPTLYSWYGRTLMRMGDPEKAKEAFKTELKNNPNDFDANLYFAILLKRDRQFDEALPHLLRARRLRPADSYARYHLGALHAATGKPVDALPLLESVAKDHPEFTENRVLLASVYYRLNRKTDGDRERAAVKKLTNEQQAKQPGAKDSPSKPPIDPNDEQDQRKERD